jgi:hypothetical protein
VSIKDQIPERCRLSEAARYVLDQEVSLPSDKPPLVPYSHELVWALGTNTLIARGNLFTAIYDEEKQDWEKQKLREEDVEINANLWFSRDLIDLGHSSLLVSNESVDRYYDLPPNTGSRVNEQTGEEWNLEAGYLFSQITVPTKKLFELFPPRKEGGLLGGQRETSQPTKRGGGRLPQYEWDEFWAELIIKLHFDGFPRNQAELVSQAMQICESLWGKEPVESVLKEKITRIYNHPRWKAEN